MKKGKLINQPVSELIASLGHTDEIVIADAGLPIPKETNRIDLALAPGIPSFEDVLKTVLEEMFVEKGFVSEDVQSHSPHILELLLSSLNDAPVEQLPHFDFKERTKKSRAIIRTGEFTPYANVILVSGPWGFDV